MRPVSKVGSIADRVQGISCFGIVSGRFLTLMFVLFLSAFLALQDLRKIAFHGMQLLDTGLFSPVFVVMGVLFGGKLLDFRLQGFMAWQLGNAMRPENNGWLRPL